MRFYRLYSELHWWCPFTCSHLIDSKHQATSNQRYTTFYFRWWKNENQQPMLTALLFSSLLFSEGYPAVQDPLTWLDIGIWRSLFLNSQFSHMKIIIGFCIYFASPSFLSFESFDGMSLLLFSLPTTRLRRPLTPEAKYLTFPNTLVLIVKRYIWGEIGNRNCGRSQSQSISVHLFFPFPFFLFLEKEKKLADLSCAVLCLIPGPLNRNVSRILSSHIPPTDLILYHVFSGFKKKERKKTWPTPLAACYRQRWNAMSTRSRCRPLCVCDCALKKARQPASGSSSFSPCFERSLLHLHGSRVPFCCDGDLWACAAFDPLLNSIQLDSTRCGGSFL